MVFEDQGSAARFYRITGEERAYGGRYKRCVHGFFALFFRVSIDERPLRLYAAVAANLIA